jgi:hypothetical protein
LAIQGKHERALLELSKTLREQVEFERNTVWKDMIGLERRGATVTVQVRYMVKCEAVIRSLPEHLRWLVILKVFALLVG